jgi:hypothetical protein
MRFMVLVPRDTNAGRVLGSADGIAAMQRYKEELVEAGVLVASGDLLPTQHGAKMRFAGERPTVTLGPFTESEDLVGAFWLLDVRSKDEAIDALKRAPFTSGTEIVIRQVFSAPHLRRPTRAARAASAKRPDRF